ncbi:hypothetical protein BUALT_Bualt03G0069000 [Buddleja alternifolia]|uniref:non-specific serine/threonine protein kinase n=1 Tax=Buddleja alternifolia TaxID=168488 RepID=A0AAV6Y025_9LAMI|nr:hypothetical protein BUALT_Bualt03G0069000 [Buddleja alternifolia]
MGFSEFRCYRNLFPWCFMVTCYFFSVFTFAADRITRGHSIRDGDTIVSAGEKFALGFFSPQGSSFRYVGIWYYRVANESVVWVANRETPISDNGGALTIGNDGNLIVLNGDDDIIWSSNVTVESNNSTVVLRDTGNLVLYSGEHINREIWQSFDHPTDTYLPDMRVQMNVHDGERRVLTSWKSANDPSPGNYSLGIDPRGSSQIVIWAGRNRWWRSGYYNGVTFTGVPVRVNYLFGFKVNNDGDGRLSFTYTPSNRSNFIKFRVSWNGTERQESWIDGRREWDLIQSHPVDECDMYNRCGVFGKCNEMDLSKCSCMEGFVAKDSACVRRKKLQCEENNSLYVEDRGKKDGFVQIERVKLPDFVDYVGSQDVKECEKMCLDNCSCTAYAFDIGINCMIWNRDLVDVQQFGESGNTLFVRVAHSELAEKNNVKKLVVITTVIIGTFFVCVLIWLIWKCKTNCQG